MTLILTVANHMGVCQSSDYRLTDRDTGASVLDRAGSKQLQAAFDGMDLRLAFTGIAEVGAFSARQRTIDWLSRELLLLPHDSTIQQVCDVLKARCAAIASPHGPRGVLEIVLTVAVLDEPFRVAVISNTDWSKNPPEANPEFTIAIHTITKPFHLISGNRGSVPETEEHRLRAVARQIGNSSTNVSEVLAEINAIAAKNSEGLVSEDCWVTSQFGDGSVRRSASLNVGQNPGGIHSLIGGFDLAEFVQKNFRPAPGQEIRLIQGAGVVAGPGGGTPLPPPTGDPKRINLDGSSVRGSLSSPAGDHPVSISVSQLDCVLNIRLNEELIVPFATVALGGGDPVSSDFRKPLLPWPALSTPLKLEGVDVPQGWEYAIGYWIEGGMHHLVIPQSSRCVRNLAFLDPSEEMIIVAPSTNMEFAWGKGGDAPSGTMHARITWRKRVDGVSG